MPERVLDTSKRPKPSMGRRGRRNSSLSQRTTAAVGWRQPLLAAASWVTPPGAARVSRIPGSLAPCSSRHDLLPITRPLPAPAARAHRLTRGKWWLGSREGEATSPVRLLGHETVALDRHALEVARAINVEPLMDVRVHRIREKARERADALVDGYLERSSIRGIGRGAGLADTAARRIALPARRAIDLTALPSSGALEVDAGKGCDMLGEPSSLEQAMLLPSRFRVPYS